MAPLVTEAEPGRQGWGRAGVVGSGGKAAPAGRQGNNRRMIPALHGASAPSPTDAPAEQASLPISASACPSDSTLSAAVRGVGRCEGWHLLTLMITPAVGAGMRGGPPGRGAPQRGAKAAARRLRRPARKL